jgi:aspartyl aminopeptidase
MDINKQLLDFIKISPTPYHAVENIGNILEKNGFKKLEESQKWDLERGKKYYTTRNGSSIIAFAVPMSDDYSFNIIASHCDSPTFKLKANPIVNKNGYTLLNTDCYGGMIMYSWMDRPLSVAGRLAVRYGDDYSTKLVNIDKDLLIIPSLAIHMDRSLNEGKKFEPQTDMLPILALDSEELNLKSLLAQAADVNEENISDGDLYLYNRRQGCILGANGEFISAPKLDNLQCAFASLRGFISADPADACPVLAVFDNEEVGSRTLQGAGSTFLRDVLKRIAVATGADEAGYIQKTANSFMLSADNAHAVHPTRAADYADATNRPVINGGIVIKYSAMRRYTSDGVSRAVFKGIVDDLGLKHQTFANRSDMIGGSTLGNISLGKVSIASVDIGLAQLAMHSAYETAGSRDTEDFVRISRRFYSTKFMRNSDGGFRLDKAARAHKPSGGSAKNIKRRANKLNV